MKRMHKRGSSEGWWLTQDNLFYIYRPLKSPAKRASIWKIGSSYPSAFAWLEEHGLREVGFPTRREALARLQDLLELSPLHTSEDYSQPRAVYELEPSLPPPALVRKPRESP